MRKRATRRYTPGTGRVAIAMGTLPHAGNESESKKNFPPELLDAQEYLQRIEDSHLKKWLAESHAKRPLNWDGVGAFRELLRVPDWMTVDPGGGITNPHIQAFNAYEKHSEEAFRTSLEELKKFWKTTEGKLKEVEHLVTLAGASNAGELTLATYTALTQWEFARYLFAHKRLDEYQMIKSSAGELVQNFGFQEPFDHPLFPLCRWSELPQKDQTVLTSLLSWNVDQAVRILSLDQWWPHLGHASSELYDLSLEQNLKASFHEGPPAPKCWEHPLETESGEASYVVLRVDWRERENTIKEALISELKRIRPNWIPTKSPGRRPERESESLRGLAYEWLKKTNLSTSKKANLIYPRQVNPSKKGAPTTEATAAGARAREKLKSLRTHFSERVPTAYRVVREWNDSFADRLRANLPPV